MNASYGKSKLHLITTTMNKRVPCIFCRSIIDVGITEDQYIAWKQSGAHVQDAFPDMSADNREILISGVCGKCFDEATETED